MKKKPWIGLVPLIDPERESLWMLPGYMEGVLAAGGIPVMLPLTEENTNIPELLDRLDALIFTGGHDVSPSFYGETPVPECGRSIPERDTMEKLLLDAALERDMPVLGICRGLQFFNAALGGTLYQDLPTQHPSGVEHEMKPPFDRSEHEVEVLENTPLYDILGPDGLIEAVWMPGKRFFLAVQWHPEHSFQKNEGSLSLFQALVKA